MKILQINCMYHRGSTGKIVEAIHKVLLSKGVESIVCYGRNRNKSKKEKGVYKYCTELEGDIHHGLVRHFGMLLYGGCYFATNKLIRIIKKEKPDVVHIHCINSYNVNVFRLLTFLANNGINTIVTNHAEFFYTGNCGHANDCMKWILNPGCGNCPNLKEASGTIKRDNTRISWVKMYESFNRFNHEKLIFTAVSPWVKSRIVQSPIANSYRCEIIENGVDTKVFNLKKYCGAIRNRVNNSNPIILHVTAQFDVSERGLKGGRFIVQLAKRMPNLNFVVASVFAEPDISLPSNVFLLGNISDQTMLAQLYSEADVTLITSRRETFSMVLAESLCCGTPVVGFKAGGPETIALEHFTKLVDYGDVDELEVAIKWFVNHQTNKVIVEEMASVRYDINNMIDSYLNLYNEFM